MFEPKRAKSIVARKGNNQTMINIREAMRAGGKEVRGKF